MLIFMLGNPESGIWLLYLICRQLMSDFTVTVSMLCSTVHGLTCNQILYLFHSRNNSILICKLIESLSFFDSIFGVGKANPIATSAGRCGHVTDASRPDLNAEAYNFIRQRVQLQSDRWRGL